MSTKAVSGGVGVELISGSVAGIVSTAVSHPLELVKTRLQVDKDARNRFGQSFRIARNVIIHEGGLRALYRGLIPNLFGNASGWALYFAFYNEFKDQVSRIRGVDGNLTFAEYFATSAGAGFITAACTNPIWVVKTRMLSTSRAHHGSYTSMSEGFRAIYRHEGIRGFYRGFIPSLYGILHGALQFMVYEQLKTFQSQRKYGEPRHQLSTVDYLWTSGLSKIIAGAATYPYQVVRSRLQMHGAEKAYRSARDVVAQIWRQEGPPGLYKGLGPNLLRVLPSTCVTFIVYESTKNYLMA